LKLIEDEELSFASSMFNLNLLSLINQVF